MAKTPEEVKVEQGNDPLSTAAQSKPAEVQRTAGMTPENVGDLTEREKQDLARGLREEPGINRQRAAKLSPQEQRAAREAVRNVGISPAPQPPLTDRKSSVETATQGDPQAGIQAATPSATVSPSEPASSDTGLPQDARKLFGLDEDEKPSELFGTARGPRAAFKTLEATARELQTKIERSDIDARVKETFLNRAKQFATQSQELLAEDPKTPAYATRVLDKRELVRDLAAKFIDAAQKVSKLGYMKEATLTDLKNFVTDRIDSPMQQKLEENLAADAVEEPKVEAKEAEITPPPAPKETKKVEDEEEITLEESPLGPGIETGAKPSEPASVKTETGPAPTGPAASDAGPTEPEGKLAVAATAPAPDEKVETKSDEEAPAVKEGAAAVVGMTLEDKFKQAKEAVGKLADVDIYEIRPPAARFDIINGVKKIDDLMKRVEDVRQPLDTAALEEQRKALKQMAEDLGKKLEQAVKEATTDMARSGLTGLREATQNLSTTMDVEPGPKVEVTPAPGKAEETKPDVSKKEEEVIASPTAEPTRTMDLKPITTIDLYEILGLDRTSMGLDRDTDAKKLDQAFKELMAKNSADRVEATYPDKESYEYKYYREVARANREKIQNAAGRLRADMFRIPTPPQKFSPPPYPYFGGIGHPQYPIRMPYMQGYKVPPFVRYIPMCQFPPRGFAPPSPALLGAYAYPMVTMLPRPNSRHPYRIYLGTPNATGRLRRDIGYFNPQTMNYNVKKKASLVDLINLAGMIVKHRSIAFCHLPETVSAYTKQLGPERPPIILKGTAKQRKRLFNIFKDKGVPADKLVVENKAGKLEPYKPRQAKAALKQRTKEQRIALKQELKAQAADLRSRAKAAEKQSKKL